MAKLSSPIPRVSGPPYPAGTLHVPLSAVQRTRMTTWMVIPHTINGTSYNLDITIVGGLADDQFLADYEAMLAGQPIPYGQGKAPIKTEWSVPSFLALLTSSALWIRVGEFAVGGILIAVGASAIVRRELK